MPTAAPKLVAAMARPPGKSPGPARRRVERGGFVATVHAQGATPLDGMLALSELASQEGPKEVVLHGLARRIAELLAVDVCSIYLLEGQEAREDGGILVLRATHGLPSDAVGRVTLRIGEGLTGFAVECLRPVSVAEVTSDARNKAFQALGEERFPALCAIPLVDGGRAVGALVVQRRQARAFGPREVVLVAAMAPPVLWALERARRAQRATPSPVVPIPRGRPREVELRGRPGAPGRAVGTMAVRRGRVATPREAGRGHAEERARLGEVMVDVTARLAELDAWAAPRLSGVARGLLHASRFVLEDARLRELAFQHVEGGAAATGAVERVAREYARRLGGDGDDHLRERAVEVEGVCERLLGRLHGDELASPPGTVLVTARLGVFDAVELAHSHGAGVALTGPARDSPGLPVAQCLGLPVVVGLRRLFDWAADGDRALVDGDAGTVIINPARTEVAAHRKGR